MKYFSTNDLPLNDEMINFWNNNGYLVIENFNTDKECDELMKRSSYLIEQINLIIKNLFLIQSIKLIMMIVIF